MRADSPQYPSPAHPDGGFTLVEILVVMLIVAILLGMAMVMFLSAQHAAQDRAAQSMAREALASAKTLFQVDEDYSEVAASTLADSEPGLEFVNGTESSDGPDVASVDAPDEDTFIIAVYSRTGTCFFIRDEAVLTGRGTTYAEQPSDGSDCAANLPPSDFRESW